MARILLVDDQQHVTLCISIFLQKHGHEIVRAEGGRSALERLRNESFDLMITDVNMPDLDGLSLISHKDEIAQLRGIIILTGRTDFDLIADMQKITSIHVVPKPFSPTHIAALVEKLIIQNTRIPSLSQ